MPTATNPQTSFRKRPGAESFRFVPLLCAAFHWLRIRPQIDLDIAARGLRVHAVRESVTIDWTVRENVRASMRVTVKRILRKHGYPPDKQARATEPELEQA
jgi:hypothetical protein